jgi:hypothetical protein
MPPRSEREGTMLGVEKAQIASCPNRPFLRSGAIAFVAEIHARSYDVQNLLHLGLGNCGAEALAIDLARLVALKEFKRTPAGNFGTTDSRLARVVLGSCTIRRREKFWREMVTARMPGQFALVGSARPTSQKLS